MKNMKVTFSSNSFIIFRLGQSSCRIFCRPCSFRDLFNHAYRAGFLTGYLRGLALDVCGKMGAVAAVYTVEKYGTQTHRFNVKEFSERYKVNFNEKLPGL